MPAGPVLALGNPRRYHSSGMLKFQEDSSRQRCCTFHSQKHQEALSPQYHSVLSPHLESLLFQLPPSILPSLAFIPYSGEKHSWPFCNERPTKMHPVISLPGLPSRRFRACPCVYKHVKPCLYKYEFPEKREEGENP